MLKPFELPELAEGIDSAVVVAILVNVGDQVTAEDIVAELENDKATAELPIPFSGVVREIHKQTGDDIRVGEPIMTVETAADGAEAPPPAASAPAASEQQPSESSPTPQQDAPPAAAPSADTAGPPVAASAPMPSHESDTSATGDATLLPAGPESRRLARELGVDLRQVAGTGPRNRIMPDDVRAHTRELLQTIQTGKTDPATAPAAVPQALPDFAKWGAIEVRPMSGIRRKTAEVTAYSWREIPHVVQHDRADITDLDALRKEWQARSSSDVKLTVTAILLKAVAAALKVFPRFNCSVDMENHQLIYKNYVHLAVAVDAGHGLLTPVIRNADQLGVFALGEALATLSAKARDKKLSIDEMSGSTFAVSNLGGLGTLSFSPIVTWPHVAVLGVGKAEMQPLWQGETFEPRRLLPLSLSYDHRANDGADAARFLRWLAEAIADPVKIIMEAG